MIELLRQVSGLDGSYGVATLADVLVSVVATFLSGLRTDLGQSLLFKIVECTPESCPGSAYQLVTAAWANIGYMTHSDFLHFVNETGFGAWAPLLYIAGAIGALFGVAMNNPPRNYTWFLLGPALFNFLIFTTTDVTGVAWRVAGAYMPMKDVWKDAETGLANTILVKRVGLSVDRDNGPSGQYPVAWALAFLDGLFSSTANRIIEWVGIGRQEGNGGANSDLARKEGSGEGPWYILANLKWGMLENIVGVQARDPDVRDALVTFLASECGDQFKKGVDTGAYAAASQSRGATLPAAVLKDGGGGASFTGATLNFGDYKKFVHGLDTEVIPTPRSIIRLFNQPDQQGSFKQFTTKWSGGGNPADDSGRTVEIVCSEYLWTIIQALRWESGHAFWQLVRSAPNGFSRNQMLQSLFYGWDIRKMKDSPYATPEELENFTKQLIFVYMLRNELLYAPQITETGQRFAPSEQTRNFSESFVRQQGSRSKSAELYNWAVMMPHLQGILIYLVVIGYPFAVMLMVIPGYWKAFFTWITFLAWIKTWDIGFAIVHTLERSVWAMIGNHSAMARVANLAIQTAEKVGYVNVGQSCGGGNNLPELCAIPDVKESTILTQPNAWGLLDKSLLLTGSADLDLANGYYVYIMAALYFAVPAVTGQLVLGAKAGLGNLATQGISGPATEAGTAAKQGTVGEAANRLATNQQSLNQGAVAKGHRNSGLVMQQLEAANSGLDADLTSSALDNKGKGLQSAATGREMRTSSFASRMNVGSALAGAIVGTNSGTGAASGAATGGDTPTGGLLSRGAAIFNFGAASKKDQLTHDQLGAAAQAQRFGASANWTKSNLGMYSGGMKDYAGKLASEAEFAAQSSAWEAKNDFATHVSGIGGVSGFNPGSLAPGPKPTDAMGLTMSGNLGSSAGQAARYSSGQFLSNSQAVTRQGQNQFGSSFFNQNWGGGFERTEAWGSAAKTPIQDFKSAKAEVSKILTDFENTP